MANPSLTFNENQGTLSSELKNSASGYRARKSAVFLCLNLWRESDNKTPARGIFRPSSEVFSSRHPWVLKSSVAANDNANARSKTMSAFRNYEELKERFFSLEDDINYLADLSAAADFIIEASPGSEGREAALSFIVCELTTRAKRLSRYFEGEIPLNKREAA